MNIPIPLETEWSVSEGGTTTLLTNDTSVGGVVLSGSNGTVLLNSPSSILMFETSQIRCSYTNAPNDLLDDTYAIFLTEAGRSCLSPAISSQFEIQMYICIVVDVKYFLQTDINTNPV